MDDLPQFQPNDLAVVVMGLTGSGKSAFIQLLVDQDVGIHHGLASSVAKAQLFPFQWRDGRRIWLLDTPGFDDTRRSDIDILKEVVPLLVKLKQRVDFAGIIYLHPITNNRMQGTARRNLSLMRAICGEAAYKHVVLTSTMWEEYRDDSQTPFKQRELFLLETNNWWGSMHSKGSVSKRHNGTLDSAQDIISHVLVQYSNHGSFMLRIHKEMIEEEKKLEETTVGKEVNREYDELMIRLERQRHDLNEEYKRALRERDDHHAVEMAEQRAALMEQLRKAEQAQQDLRTEYDDMARSTRDKHKLLVQQLQRQCQEANLRVQNLEEQLRVANMGREQDRQTHEREKAIYMERISKLEVQNRHQEVEREQDRQNYEREKAINMERISKLEVQNRYRETEREKTELVRYNSDCCPGTVNTRLQLERSYLDAIQERKQLRASCRGHINIIVFLDVIG